MEWGSPKIKYSTLQLNKEQGGLGLCDLRAKQIKLKLQWIHRASFNKFWEDVINASVENSILWTCNLSVEHARLIWPRNNFWSQTMWAWCEFHYSPFFGHRDHLLGTPVLFNSQIIIQGLPLRNATFLGDNVFIENFLTEGSVLDDGHFLLEWAIKAQIKKIPVPSPSTTTWVESYQEFSLESKPVSYVTRLTKERINPLVKYHAKWEHIIGITVEYEDFERNIVNINKITSVVKLRNFQYKLMMLACITNVKLFYFKTTSSQLCTFCQNHKETYVHLFCECDFVRPIWSVISRGHLTTHQILWNCIDVLPKTRMNISCLYAKQYIYARKCEQKLPNVKDFENFLKKSISYEEKVALRKGKIVQFKKIWS